MKLNSIRWRIAIPYLLLIIFTMAGVGWMLTNYLEDIYLQNLENNLVDNARIIVGFLTGVYWH